MFNSQFSISVMSTMKQRRLQQLSSWISDEKMLFSNMLLMTRLRKLVIGNPRWNHQTSVNDKLLYYWNTDGYKNLSLAAGPALSEAECVEVVILSERSESKLSSWAKSKDLILSFGYAQDRLFRRVYPERSRTGCTQNDNRQLILDMTIVILWKET